MPAKREGPSLKQITRQVLEELDGPAPVDVVVEHVLASFPFQSKHPSKRVRDFLHSYNMVGVELVFLDPKTIVPLRVAMRGVRFRVPLGQNQIKEGLLTIQPSFVPFLIDRYNYVIPREGIELNDANDQIIPALLTKVRRKEEGFWGGGITQDYAAFDLRGWLVSHRARAKDSIQVTILNWRPARVRLEFEPHSQYRRSAFEAQNRALADCVQTLLDESYKERIYTNPAILTAYARIPAAHDYPGDHWLAVLANDPRFFVTDFDIKRGEGVSTVDFLHEPFSEPELRGQPFTREQGNRVYRFRARGNYGKQKHVIEILGRHTLADFDDIMRAAFDLDVWDHLSEFTRITRRGKGKMPREEQYGEINPFEPTPAMKLRLSGLGFGVGAELEYLYDFGDCLRHTVVLESIGEKERGVTYPRVVR